MEIIEQLFNSYGGSKNPPSKEEFIYEDDSSNLEKSISYHWESLINGKIADYSLEEVPPYHLIYAYFLENTRIYQIVEKLIFMFRNDEELGVAIANNQIHKQAFNWITNTENIYFKTLPNTSYLNYSGNLRPNPEASRRNAYFRLLGMDLAFGMPTNPTSNEFVYHKPKFANREFILLFEQFLSEVWQAYINASNSSGANTTDYERIKNIVTKIRLMLMARRGGSGFINLADYRYMNLSKEEFNSVILMYWLLYVFLTNSPLIVMLGCQANSPSERLEILGQKVGLPAHKKSMALMELAGPSAAVLRAIEFGTFELTSPDLWIQKAIESRSAFGSPVASDAQKQALTDLLNIINNWENATGHRIKNPEGGISGRVSLQNGNKPEVTLN